MKTNCYLVHDGDSIAVIDPGDEPERILNLILQYSKKPIISILLTHGHADHISAVPFLISKFPTARIFSGRADNLFLYDPSANLSKYNGNIITFTDISSNISNVTNGEEIACGNYIFRVLETPGHTPGSITFILDNEGVVFCGDLIFKESIGPASLPFGDEKKLYNSIEQRILPLNTAWKLCPGHGEYTTISHEKEYNPYLNTISQDDDLI